MWQIKVISTVTVVWVEFYLGGNVLLKVWKIEYISEKQMQEKRTHTNWNTWIKNNKSIKNRELKKKKNFRTLTSKRNDKVRWNVLFSYNDQ